MFDRLQKCFDAASQAYCVANGLARDTDWFILKLQEKVGELTQAWNRLSGRARRKGRSSEELRRNLEMKLLMYWVTSFCWQRQKGWIFAPP